MSEELTYKRKRSISDDDDTYEPSMANAESAPVVDEPEDIPPHLQQDQQDQQEQQPYHSEQHHHQEQSWSETNNKRMKRSFLPRELEAAKSITGDISRLGDNPIELSRDFDMISDDIVTNLRFGDDFKMSVAEFICGVVLEQPHKIFVVCNLIQLCNDKDGGFGSYLIEYLKFKLDELFNSLNNTDNGQEEEEEAESNECGKFTKIKSILRLLSCLSPILKNGFESIYAVFQNLLKVAIGLQDGNDKRSPLGELLYFVVISSIPYLLASNLNDKENVGEYRGKLKDLLTELGFDFKITDEISTDSVYKHFNNSDEAGQPFEPKRLVELVLPAVLEIVNNNDEQLEYFNQTYQLIQPKLSDETKLHELTGFNLPSLERFQEVENNLEGNIDSLWSFPRYYLNVFLDSDNDFETVPKIESYLGIVLNDNIQDHIQNTEFNRVTVSKQLLILNQFYNEKLFAKPNSSIDKLTIINDLKGGINLVENLASSSDVDSDIKNKMIFFAKSIENEFKEGYQSTLKMEEIVTESIVNLMFSLPDLTNVKAIYYQTLLVDICSRDWTLMKKSENSNEKVNFAKVLGSSIRYFYRNFEKLDFELRLRFIDWMLIQLSNFGFDWQWVEWIEDLERFSANHPRLYLIRNIIAKEIRVSSPKTIKISLPDEYHQFLKLSLLNEDELIEYDSNFVGLALSTEINETNSNLEMDIENISIDAGNAEIYYIVDQYLFNNQDHPYHEICHDIYTNIQEGEPLQDFNNLIIKLKDAMESNKIEDLPELDFNRYVINLVIQSVCIIGSRSLSVIEGGALELSGSKLRKVLGLPLLEDDEEFNQVIENDQFEITEDSDELKKRQTWLIEGVLRLWNNEPRIGYLILEKIKNKGFISGEQIIDSVFKKKMHLNQVYVVELINRLLIEGGVSKELITYYINKSVNSIRVMIDGFSNLKDVENIDDVELKWDVKNSVSLLKSQLRQFTKFVNLDEFRKVIELEFEDKKVVQEELNELLRT